MLLVNRNLLLSKLQDIENSVRGSLRSSGYGRESDQALLRDSSFGARESSSELAAISSPLLRVRRVVLVEFCGLDRMALKIARGDAVCRRLMTVPGVGVTWRSYIGPVSTCLALHPLSRCWGSFWPDTTSLQLRSSRLRWSYQPLRRRDGAHRALSSSTRPYASRALVWIARLGDEDRKEERCQTRQSRSRAQACRCPTSHVDRWNRVPVDNPRVHTGCGSVERTHSQQSEPASLAVNGYPDGYEGWTSPHRWLPPMDNVDRARGRAWPSIPSQPILSAGVIPPSTQRSMNSSGALLPIEENRNG
jgi:hypothetical protein